MRRSRLWSFLNDGCRATCPIGCLPLAILVSCAAFAPQRADAGVAAVGRAAAATSSNDALVWPADPAEGPSLFSPVRGGSAVVYIPQSSNAQATSPVSAPAKIVDATPSDTERSDVSPVATETDRGVILVPLPLAQQTGLVGLLVLGALMWVRRVRRSAINSRVRASRHFN